MYKSILILSSILIIFSCQSQLDPNDESATGNLSMQMDMAQAPSEVLSIEGQLSREDFETVYFEFEINGQTATAAVEDLAQDSWHLLVNALDNNDSILYTGESDVDIKAGQVTPVSLQLNPATGTLKITVTWNTQNPDIFYYNSFESAADTAGWQGYYELWNDTPANGGLVSMYVTGGCIWPHAYYMFEPLDRSGTLTLKCQAKVLANGGSINLGKWGNHGEEIYIEVQDSTWQEYTSEKTLQVSAGDTLMLSVNSGGIVYGAMLVDNLKIIEQ